MRITLRRLPPEVSTLYVELVEQLTAFEARRSIGHAGGTFVTKNVKGRTYAYFQHSVPGARPEQVYLGRRTPELDALAERYASERRDLEGDRETIERLCSLLRAGGAATIDGASARVIASLAEAAVFRLGGMLVGTHAFIAIGNMLGVRWEGGLLRTQDIDVAGEATLAVAVPGLQTDVPAAIESLRMGFLPVPGLSPAEPSTSFKVRGRSLRLDLLTPKTGESPGPVFIPRFRASAAPLSFLDYLLEAPHSAAVIDGSGVLVQVPDPARFALHKLLVAQDRTAAWHAKRDKDLRQAGHLVAFLSEDRPGDLGLAREALERRGKLWRRALAAGLDLLERRLPGVRTLGGLD